MHASSYDFNDSYTLHLNHLILTDTKRVNSHIQAIVAMAAEYYEPACISLRLRHIDGTCNSSNDPYKSIAKSKQILEEFTAEWRDNRENVRRDVAHLFSGTSFDRGILGWAWKNTVCSKANGYGKCILK